MLRLVVNRRSNLKTSVILLLILVAVVSTSFLLQSTAQEVNAQTNAATMSQLLKQLNEEEKQITFRFVVPLIADENIWVIPSENIGENNDISRQIGEIGDDYICFNELAGQAYTMQCTFFSNIAAINFLNQPQ